MVWLAIIALLCWSGSDLFSKIGCRDGRDQYNPLKMVIAVGVVMGIHAAYEIFVGGAVVTWHVMWTYLPVSLLYIGSMTLGYVGLRYIELSIVADLQFLRRARGGLCLITGTLDGVDHGRDALDGHRRGGAGVHQAWSASASSSRGGDDELRKKRQECSNYKYAKSWLALCLPVAYCLLDAGGHVRPVRLVLRTLNAGIRPAARYELTFWPRPVICFIYVVIIRRTKLVFKAEAPKYAGALFETAGRFAHILRAGRRGARRALGAVITAYCVASVCRPLERIFLKKSPRRKRYTPPIALVDHRHGAKSQSGVLSISEPGRV
ncbi:MAG: hypothetical protein ACLU3F_15220 [Blautia wexlerae]